VPRGHIEFLESFGDTFSFGDYLFVHAGIRPGIGLDEQVRRDLRWIREPFLATPRSMASSSSTATRSSPKSRSGRTGSPSTPAPIEAAS
jgi:hypothetical protein